MERIKLDGQEELWLEGPMDKNQLDLAVRRASRLMKNCDVRGTVLYRDMDNTDESIFHDYTDR